MILVTPFGMIKFMLSMMQLAAMIPITIGALILNFILSDNFIALPYTKGGIVDVGWPITRDLANMGLVLILIVIAVSTIIGSERRGLRSLLPKLIGIALIINFTQVIAGVIIDFANLITYYFLSPVTNIGNLFIQVFWEGSPFYVMWSDNVALLKNFSPENLAEWLKGNLSIGRLLGDMIQTVAIWIISLMLMVALLSFAVIYFARYIVVWLLVIVSPLAFVAMILPDTAKFASQWWQKFVHWSFIGVFPAFMLFLVGKMIELKNNASVPAFGSITQQVPAQPGGFVDSVFSGSYSVVSEFLFWTVVIIFMFIGLMASIKMNSKMSNIIVKRGKTVINNVGKWASKEAWQRAGRSQMVQGAMTKAEEGMGRIPTALGGGILERAARNAQHRMQERSTQKFKDAEKEAKSLNTSHEAMYALGRAVARNDDVRVTEYLKRSLELNGGRYDRVQSEYLVSNPTKTEADFKRMYDSHVAFASRYNAGIEDNLRKARPDLYSHDHDSRITKQMQDNFYRTMGADDWNKVSYQSFAVDIDPDTGLDRNKIVREKFYQSDHLNGTVFARSTNLSDPTEIGDVVENADFNDGFMRQFTTALRRNPNPAIAKQQANDFNDGLTSYANLELAKDPATNGPGPYTKDQRLNWLEKKGPAGQNNVNRFFRRALAHPTNRAWLG